MNGEILGHSVQQKALARLAASGKLPTTILFSGIAGVGKFLVAKRLAFSLLCRESAFGGCGHCEYCSLLHAETHPDFFSVQCASKECDIDSLRELLYSLNLKSFFGKNRVVIFNNADELGVQSANLLLKSLEEPRPNTYYILVATHRGSLPPTLVSRCQVWFFDRLADSAVKTLLASKEAAIQAAGLSLSEVVALADGSLAQVDTLIEKSELWKKLGSTLDQIAAGKVSLAPELAAELAKDKEHLSESLKLLRLVVRSRMLSATNDEDKARWAICLSNLLTCERAIFERNLAAATVLLSTFLALHSAPQAVSFTTLHNSARLLDNVIV